LESMFNLQWTMPKKTYYETSYELRKQWKMKKI
jgi:hypothetical protein